MAKQVKEEGFPLVVNYQQGTMLLSKTGETWPEKFSEEKKFGIDVRTTFTRNARQFFKAVKKISPGFQQRPKMLPVFGDPKNWNLVPFPTDERGKTLPQFQSREPNYEIVDYFKTETLWLNAQARDFVSSVLYLLTDPDSKACMSAMLQEDNVWGLAEQLNVVPWLEKKIGLNGVGGIAVEYGPAPSEKTEISKAAEDVEDPVPTEAAG
jgi:hypothetical protein